MGDGGKYLGDAVYGALDGIVTTFAIVAGVSGAGLSSGIILVLGFANLFGDGISMAAGSYLGKRSDIEYRKQRRLSEQNNIDRDPDHHRARLEQVYRKKGFSGPQLSGIVATITSDRVRWADEMVSAEAGVLEEDVRPLRSAIATLAAFVIAGLVPLLSYLLAMQFPFVALYSLSLACALTALALFVVGGLRSLLTPLSWWRAGIEMLLVGGMAAGVAYVIGWGLSSLV